MIGRTSIAVAGVVALALSLFAAGCGEKSEPATTGPVDTTGQTTTTNPGQQDRAAVEEAASDFLLVAGPTVCDEGITPKLLKSAYGDRAGCVAARKPDAVATQIDLDPIVLNGESATVKADAKGGTYGKGERVTMTVVRSGNAWLVDAVKSDTPVGP